MEDYGSLESYIDPSIFMKYSRPGTSAKTCATTGSGVLKRQSFQIALEPAKQSTSYAVLNERKIPSKLVIKKTSKSLLNTRPQSQSPDYPKMHTRVTDIKVRSYRPKSQIKTPETVTLQEQVRNELLYILYRLKSKHYIIRSMKKMMRSDEEKTTSHQKNMFSRLVYLFNSFSVAQESGVKATPTENLVQKHSVVKAKDIVSRRDFWLKKRGYKANNQDYQTAKEVYSMLDCSKAFKAKDFLEFLIKIGITFPFKTLNSTLLRTFKTNSLENYVITEPDIVNLCKDNNFNTNLLKKLLENTSKLIKNTEMTSVEDVYTTISASDIESTLKFWWEELDTFKRNQIHLNQISEFLVIKEIVKDQTEARKYLLNLFRELAFIDYTQFLMIFSKTVIKWGLKVLCYKIKIGDYYNY
jgi:hypothetical protein